MKKAFVYGVAVEGENFTDRIEETRRLKRDFENGQNVVLISPRRMGKTSLVRRVISQVDTNKIAVVHLDIYDCRTEYEFYNKLATAVLKQVSKKGELMLRNIKEFLTRLTPRVSFGIDPANEMSVSLGIAPEDYSPEEILQLPEKMAHKIGKHIVICIDEFQQIGNFPDSIDVQKRIRGVWQLQEEVSYCLYGSKKHMLTNLFQNKRMPFYQFGDIRFLQPIALDDWIPFIRGKFEESGLLISDEQITRICETVEYQSSYVQQLAWNVMLCCDKVVDETAMEEALDDLIGQSSILFLQQTEGLSSYQMNFLKALVAGETGDFTSAAILKKYHLGTKSNISRLTDTLIKKELIEKTGRTITIADPVFRLWMQREHND
ncbi:MAG: ATP-binding protein [Bacteroidales bacterium]|nr:ATP-binding protein [Bacteroidales bacterium]